MAPMQTVGNGHVPTSRARLREQEGRYVVELDVSDFTESELAVVLVGRTVTVRGEQIETPVDEGRAFRLRERLEESFRLPEDVDADQTKVFHRRGTLEIQVPKAAPRSRRLPITARPTCLIDPGAEPC
jgi:HSP20 family molecular chaperone IbpA